jgi:hypothetical protein
MTSASWFFQFSVFGFQVSIPNILRRRLRFARRLFSFELFRLNISTSQLLNLPVSAVSACHVLRGFRFQACADGRPDPDSFSLLPG